MKKKIVLICFLILFLFCTLSMSFAFGLKGEKALKNHPEFLNIEQEWGNKIGTHYLVNLTENRILEFDQIDPGNGGGKYACLQQIGEFTLRGSVKYPKDSSFEDHWKDRYGSYARFSDLSQATGLKIKTMTDVIDHYDEILDFVKKIANELYISGNYEYRVDSEDRKASIWVSDIHGYSFVLWHGVKGGEVPPYNKYFGPEIYDVMYGENWREKLNSDLPKIRKSLGLE